MTSPVSILYHNPAVADVQGWAGQRGRQLVEAMRRAGADVECIPAFQGAVRWNGARRGGRRRWLWERVPARWYGTAIRLRLIQRGTLNSFVWTWRLWRQLRHRRPDVILARYRELEWTPLLVAQLLRRPLVLEAHSPAAVEHVIRGGRSSRFLAWMDRQMFRRSTIVWVHTPELEQLVLGYGADADRVQLIPFGIEDRGVRANPGSDDAAVKVVFAGSFFTWHGVDQLVRAFALAREVAPQTRLTMVGDGIARQECEDLASRLGLTGSVAFTGWLEPRELYERLEMSHIGVAPYLDTTYNYFEPVKILDYEMVGLPIVASAVGHIPAMVVDGEGGLLVPPADVQALADALARLAQDPAMRETMGRVAHSGAQRIDDTAAHVVEVCQSARR